MKPIHYVILVALVAILGYLWWLNVEEGTVNPPISTDEEMLREGTERMQESPQQN